MNVSLVESDVSYETSFSEVSGQLITDGNRPNSSESLESGDRHGRLLLAALLENFCRLYESDSKKAERLFAVLCSTLSAMGILDQENVDELAGVRSQYSKAFKNLMLQAKEAVEREDDRNGSALTRAIRYSNLDSDTSDESSSELTSRASDLFSVNSQGGRLSLADWLGFDDTKYNAEFEELGLLGRGGFGAVYHVRNKIDEREYAVKKIVMRRANTNQAKIYREIKTLARLEHPNIIRYFSSWLEHSRTDRSRPSMCHQKKLVDEGSNDMLFLMDHDEPSFSSLDKQQYSSTDDSHGIVFEASDHDLDDRDDEEDEDDYGEEDDEVSAMSLRNRRFLRKIHSRKDSHSSGGTATSLKSVSTGTITVDEDASSMPSSRYRRPSVSGSIEEIPRASFNTWFSSSVPHTHTKFNRRRRRAESNMCLTLFIQMHLCPTTLRDHIRSRNSAYCQIGSTYKDKIQSSTYIDLFRAILEGARYVHRSGLCHRDIKPSNIFFAEVDASERGAVQVLDTDGQHRCIVPKLGDFGLVLPTSTDGESDGNDLEDEDGVGTAVYGAPEQFARGESAVYQMTSKCDVYALGIVFFEMLHYTSTTAMERAKLLTDLRKGILPDEFVQQHPTESAIILAMTCHDPNKRPSVEEILEMEILVSKKEMDKDKELHRMRMENEALKKRIEELEQGKKSSETIR